MEPYPLTVTDDHRLWFGDSKVVDTNGNPLVVYHGGAANIETFDPTRAGTALRSDWGRGIYFTPSHWLADGYRENAMLEADTEGQRLWDEYEAEAKRLGTTVMNATIDLGYDSEEYRHLQAFHDRWKQRREEVRKAKGGEVYPAFVKLVNPLVYTYEGITDPFLAEQAQSGGHDGIIVKSSDGHVEEVIAFRPDQIRILSPREQQSQTAAKTPRVKGGLRM